MCPCARDSFTFAGGRRLLGGGGRSGHLFAAPAGPPAVLWAHSTSTVDAQRPHLERVLGATTTVLFVASLSYVALSALYGCIQKGCRRRRRRARRESAGAASCVVEVEATKRALEEIPVHVHVIVAPARVDGGGAGADVEASESEETAADCCAVCLAEYAAGDEVRVLPACRHGFHRECVDRWLLTRAPTCPVCRAPVVPVEKPDAEDCATGHAGVGGVAAGSTVIPTMWP